MFRVSFFLSFLLVLLAFQSSIAQTAVVFGKISSEGVSAQGISIQVLGIRKGATSNREGSFHLHIPRGKHKIIFTGIGYQNSEHLVELDRDSLELNIELTSQPSSLDQVVVTGTLKPVMRSESPVPVEVYTPQFLKKNPSPSIFEALQNVNGVRPQINCSVCNTGDIHINGLEGPYTMVTIDGMPIVSSLATVYGLFGIPSQLIERIEIVKGPASSLYGSEAVGGLINIITKNPLKAPSFTADLMTTSWREHNVDLGMKFKAGEKTHSLLGINYFNFQNREDRNNDQFTDVTLQHRISVFNKWSWTREENRIANLAWRYFYEDRWGGDMRFEKKFRGSDSIYGESIYTNRFELIGTYQLPIREKIVASYSYNYHQQNSYYGITPYFANQQIAFGQLTWDKEFSPAYQLLAGIAMRYTYYDDNSTATIDTLTKRNAADKIILPGIFVQQELKLNQSQRLLLGLRYDRHSIHGNILTPRIAYKLSLNKNNIIRLNAGTGFRVVNLFTEDHAALTGSRTVNVTEDLKPERSYNMNLNYTSKIPLSNSFLGLDGSAWYTHFTNQIVPDYLTNPKEIIYSNLDGYAVSYGMSLNLEYNFTNRLKALMGATLQEVNRVERTPDGKSVRKQPMFTEKWSGTWLISYSFPLTGITLDYTGNIYGPMHLPLISSQDPRSSRSPVWSIQNIQVTKKLNTQFEVYAGIKNLLNWTPARSNPFIIARTNDPFNKAVVYDNDGNVQATPDNPYALSFDPSYVYAPNQERRGFLGVRMALGR